MKSVGTITHIEPMVYSVADVSRRDCHIMYLLPPTYVIYSSLQFGKNMSAAISVALNCLRLFKFLQILAQFTKIFSINFPILSG